ncbi:MAG: hypothetical protein ACOZNI_16740 [Myxococcota bacterium]
MLLALASASAADFWSHWGDGKGEISTYTLVQPRYGGLHPGGDAVLIFVTEDFSWSERVKADPGEHPSDDVRPVLKLNALREFDTGIYTYDVMTSVFVRVDAGDGMAAGDPIKITFSAQEWCGMVYDELTMGPGRVHLVSHTYFDSDTRPPTTHKVPADVVYGDELPILVRGLRGDLLARGATITVPYFPARMADRFAHVAPKLTTARIARAASPETITVPAGTFSVERWSVTPDGGDTTVYFVEVAEPRRIVAWETSAGERAELRGGDRLPYWQLHNPGDRGERARLGL